jgi:hypothetical protein
MTIHSESNFPAQAARGVGTKITSLDLESGIVEEAVIVDDFALVCEGLAYLDSLQYDENDNSYRIVIKFGTPA